MRNWTRTARSVLIASGALATLAACSGDAILGGPDDTGRAALHSVSPANGVTGVSITMSMAMNFSRPMGRDMEKYIVVHEGSLTGSAVGGKWRWSSDRRTLTFTPDVPLRARTTYVIHMGGDMQGQNGRPLDHTQCASLGGRAVSEGMMSGGMGMMGAGWRGADGSYGMIFTFTTA